MTQAHQSQDQDRSTIRAYSLQCWDLLLLGFVLKFAVCIILSQMPWHALTSGTFHRSVAYHLPLFVLYWAECHGVLWHPAPCHRHVDMGIPNSAAQQISAHPPFSPIFGAFFREHPLMMFPAFGGERGIPPIGAASAGWHTKIWGMSSHRQVCLFLQCTPCPSSPTNTCRPCPQAARAKWPGPRSVQDHNYSYTTALRRYGQKALQRMAFWGSI